MSKFYRTWNGLKVPIEDFFSSSVVSEGNTRDGFIESTAAEVDELRRLLSKLIKVLPQEIKDKLAQEWNLTEVTNEQSTNNY
jgi:hypothetical protein